MKLQPKTIKIQHSKWFTVIILITLELHFQKQLSQARHLPAGVAAIGLLTF